MKLFNSIKKVFFPDKKNAHSDKTNDSVSSKLNNIVRTEFEELGYLTASIEHELRSPLGVLQSEIMRMERRFQQDIQISEFIYRIKEQITRINNAINIISIIRSSEDDFENRSEIINVNELIYSSVKFLKREINVHRIDFNIDFKVNNLRVKGVSSLLGQAIVNILKNAVEATLVNNKEKGVVKIKVSKQSNETESVRIEIIDNGVGISKEDLDKIMTSFLALKNERKAVGMGLFITQKILSFHKGKIEFASGNKKATIVSIILPRYDLDRDRSSF